MRFYDPADYTDASCALFVDGVLSGTHDDYASAMLKAFELGDDVRKHVRYVPSPLHPPPEARMADEAARERACVVRKSSDALFMRRQLCGTPNAWSNTAAALSIQAVRCLRIAASRCNAGRHATAAALEVALCCAHTLAQFCAHVPELRRCVRQTATSCGDPLRRAVCEEVSKETVASAGVSANDGLADLFRRWYRYADGSDAIVAAWHASADMRSRRWRPVCEQGRRSGTINHGGRFIPEQKRRA